MLVSDEKLSASLFGLRGLIRVRNGFRGGYARSVELVKELHHTEDPFGFVPD